MQLLPFFGLGGNRELEGGRSQNSNGCAVEEYWGAQPDAQQR